MVFPEYLIQIGQATLFSAPLLVLYAVGIFLAFRSKSYLGAGAANLAAVSFTMLFVLACVSFVNQMLVISLVSFHTQEKLTWLAITSTLFNILSFCLRVGAFVCLLIALRKRSSPGPRPTVG